MSDRVPLRMRKHLPAVEDNPVWPDGVRMVPVSTVDPAALHAILVAAYASGFGSVGDFHTWWSALNADEEYDADLLLVAADAHGAPIGLAQSWISGFIKDVAVAASWQGKGIGEALLRATFVAFSQRGVTQVDLKVVATNLNAINLYRRLGMIEAPL